jgi:hypothetical protein
MLIDSNLDVVSCRALDAGLRTLRFLLGNNRAAAGDR